MNRVITHTILTKNQSESHILNLLDMANAGLGQLNAVQQGTVKEYLNLHLKKNEKQLKI